MQDGAIVHLTEDGTWKHKVPDDHVIMCVHTPTFWREKTCFFLWQIILEYQGHYFSLETDNNTIDCELDSSPTLWAK